MTLVCYFSAIAIKLVSSAQHQSSNKQKWKIGDLHLCAGKKSGSRKKNRTEKKKKKRNKSKTTSKTHIEILVETLLFYYHLSIQKMKEDIFSFFISLLCV